MKITIAIPSYNKEKYIRRCIESALVEKKHISKIILVDNYSTDSTFAIAKEYKPDIECYQNETNLGMAMNWNRCIDLCDTEWLLILHADDELVPGSISKYIEYVEKYPTVSLIHANSYSITEGDLSTKSFTKKNQRSFWSAGLEAMKCHYGVCSAVMVRKDVYEKLGYFIESLASDAEMWSRIASKYDVGFIDEPTVIYHVSKTSTGFEGLTKRSVGEIKRDWDFLYTTMANNYPTEMSRNIFLNEIFASYPGSYYAVAKANLKIHNYIKAAQIFWLIISTYNGLFPLLEMVTCDFKKYIKKRVTIAHAQKKQYNDYIKHEKSST